MRFISKYKILVAILLAAIIWLQIDLWSSSNGVGSIVQLQAKVDQLNLQNAKIKARNDSLYDEVLSLRHNNEVIEGLARMDLGLIKKGETFYQVIPQGGS